MYVRDARGGMRPVLVDANQIPHQKSGGWTQKTTTTTRRVHEGGRSTPGRQGGLLVTRRDASGSREALTPSVFDTLPRGDIGGPPRLSAQSRSTSHLSLPPSVLSRSNSNLKSVSRSSSLKRKSRRQSDDDSAAVEEIYRYRNRSNSGSRQRRRSRTPSGSRLHVYESSGGSSLRGSRRRLDDNISMVSEPVLVNRVMRPVSRGPTPSRASVHSSVYGSRNQLPQQLDVTWRQSQASLVNRQSSMGRQTPSMVNGYGHASRNTARTPSPPLQYNTGRSSVASQGLLGSRHQLNTPIPGGEVTAVDPELKEAEKDGNQYFISMNLNAALTRPGFNGSMNQLDQIDDYSLNGSRMNLDNGLNGRASRNTEGGRYMDNGRYMDDGRYADEGLHTSRINVVDYDAVIPSRPNSRSVSVMQLADRDTGSMYGSRSILDGYVTDGALIEDSYIVKSVKATKSRPTSRMSSYVRDSGDEKVEFDLELLGLGGGGGKRTVVRGGVMNGASTPRPGTASLSEYAWQESTARHSANLHAGPEPRFTMKLNDTLLMDYLPNEGEEVREESWSGSDVSDNRSRQSRQSRQSRASRGKPARRAVSYDEEEETRETFSRQNNEAAERELEREKRRLEEELEAERRRLQREKEKMDEEKRRAEEERRKAEAERRRLELERERRRQEEEAERRRLEKEREKKRLEEEAEKERDRKRKEEEAAREKEREAKMRRMLADLDNERKRLEEERERERRRRELEAEREKEREKKRLAEERLREKQRQAEEDARRKQLEQEERDRLERLKQEAAEREKRRRQEEREREQRKKEEEEREKERKRREAEERERERRRMEEEEKERERKRREAEAKEKERQRKEDEARERERQRREAEDRERERKRREAEEKERERERERQRREAEERERERKRQEEERERERKEDERRKREAEAREREREKELERLRELDEARRRGPSSTGGSAGSGGYPVEVSRTQAQYGAVPSGELDDDDDHVDVGRYVPKDEGDGPDESWVRQRAMDFRKRLPTTKETSGFVKRLLKDAPPGSVRQTVHVEREEEEIKGPLPAKTENLLNLDTVSEKVNMTLDDGLAELTVKVRCERIVPIRGADDLYKKSSVIVSRVIEVDLEVTKERRDLYKQVMENRREGGRLSNEDTFELYKAFMELAEAEEALGGSAPLDQKIRIDKKVDEERYRDLQRDRRAYGRPGDEDFVGLYEPGIASADFDTDDLAEKRSQRSRISSRSPAAMSRLTGARQGRTPQTRKHGRRSGGRRLPLDSDTSDMR